MARSSINAMIAATLAALVLVGVPTQARTQSALSERLNKLWLGARHNAKPSSPLGDLTRTYDQALAGEAGRSPEERRTLLKARASVYELAKEYDRAESDLTAALKTQPSDPSDYVDRGYFYLRHRRYAEALQDFTAGARAVPTSARFRYGAARVEAAMENYAAAIELYDQAIRLNPKDGISYLSRAEANLNLRKLADAKADYDRAIGLGLPRRVDKYFGYVGRGYVNLLQESFIGAVADFDAALDIDPYAVNAWIWRGVADERQGRSDAAISDFEHAYAVDPDNAMVLSNLRRLRSHEPQAAQIPAFRIEEKRRLVDDLLPGPMPRRLPQM